MRPSARELTLDDEVFAMMSHWIHLAILSLMETKGFKSNAGWIGRRLGEPAPRVLQALERLELLGFIKQENGVYVLSTGPTQTKTDVASRAVREYHRHALTKILNEVDDIPLEARDIQSMTLAIDSTRIPVAKQLIASFRKTLGDFLESGERNEVYHLNIQLFPVSKGQVP